MITEVSAELSWLRKTILEKEQEKKTKMKQKKTKTKTKMKQKKRNKQNNMRNKRTAIRIAHRFWQYAENFLLIAWVNLINNTS